MKALILMMFVLMTNVFAGEKGNGGDPFEVEAIAFPEQVKLEQAMTLVTEKLEAVQISAELRNDLLSEMRSLSVQGKYLYLESIILLGPSEGYEVPQDARSFLGLGAMTSSAKNKPIYFSSRSLKHDLNTFAELLLHELLHHVVMHGLSQDEEFVEALAKNIFSGQIDTTLMKAYQLGLYLRPGKMMREQLWDALTKNKSDEWALHYEVLKKSLPENLAMVSLDQVTTILTGVFFDISSTSQNYVSSAKRTTYIKINEILGSTGKRINNYLPSQGLRRTDQEYCKVKLDFFGGCSSYILMKDLIK